MPWLSCAACGATRVSGQPGAMDKHASGLYCLSKQARKASYIEGLELNAAGWERSGSYTHFLRCRGVEIREGLSGGVKRIEPYEPDTVFYGPMWAVRIAEQNSYYSPAIRGAAIDAIVADPDVMAACHKVMISIWRLAGWKGAGATACEWIETIRSEGYAKALNLRLEDVCVGV